MFYQDHTQRMAKFGDIPRLIILLRGAHAEFGHEDAPPDDEHIRNTLQRLINQREGFVSLLDFDGELKGVFMGVINRLWYSRKRQAVDIIYYVTEDCRGYGARLLTEFIAWARNQPGVVEINLGIMSGFKESDRVERMFHVMGAHRLGGMWRLLRTVIEEKAA